MSVSKPKLSLESQRNKLYNRLDLESAKKRLADEGFNRKTVSFYNYFKEKKVQKQRTALVVVMRNAREVNSQHIQQLMDEVFPFLKGGVPTPTPRMSYTPSQDASKNNTLTPDTDISSGVTSEEDDHSDLSLNFS